MSPADDNLQSFLDLSGAPATARAALAERYRELVAGESAEPDPGTVYVLNGLPQDSVEYRTLRAAGVVDPRRPRRSELLAAGYVFANQMGDASSPLLSGRVPHQGGTLDLARRWLLAADELSSVHEFQQEMPQRFGIDGWTPAEVRGEILTLLTAASAGAPFTSLRDRISFCLPASARDPHWRVGTPEQRQTVEHYWTALVRLTEHRAAAAEASRPAAERLRPGDVERLKVLRSAYAAGEHPELMARDYVSTSSTLDGVRRFMRGGMAVTLLLGAMSSRSPSPYLGSALEIDSAEALWLDDPERGVHGVVDLVTAHLLGGHPDYPGLSPMSPDHVALGAFVRGVVQVPQPVRAEELQAIAPRSYRERVIERTQGRLIDLATAYDFGAATGELGFDPRERPLRISRRAVAPGVTTRRFGRDVQRGRVHPARGHQTGSSGVIPQQAPGPSQQRPGGADGPPGPRTPGSPRR